MRPRPISFALVTILTVAAVVLLIRIWPKRAETERATAAGRWVVVGLDGADWGVIQKLWAQDRLPNLRRIADQGMAYGLITDYQLSPIIWTTVATGRFPPDHGITNFVVPTEAGDVPVSSVLRKVPAIWNIVSSVGLRTAVIGWWASWPAESVNGLVVSDRALRNLEDRVWPPEYLAEFESQVQQAEVDGIEFEIGSSTYREDTVNAFVGEQAAGGDFDLVMVYLRSIDLVSHTHWKYFEPDGFGEISPELIERYGGLVPGAYEAVDQAIGRIMDAMPEGSNLMVLSDHGFRAASRETVKVFFDFDRVLERLGFLTRGPGGVDLERSRIYTFNTPVQEQHKMLRVNRLGGETDQPAPTELRQAALEALEEGLERVLWRSGEPAFSARLPLDRESARGADLVVEVIRQSPSKVLLIDGEPFSGAVSRIARFSGHHTPRTHGVVFASGPDVKAGPVPEGFSIHDITPTLLYGLGLPVAEDFAGPARVDMFTPEFRARVALRKIPSWGTRVSGEARPSEVDSELVLGLRALGYLE